MSPRKTIEKKRITKQSVSSIKNLENRKNSSKSSNKITNSLLTSKNYLFKNKNNNNFISSYLKKNMETNSRMEIVNKIILNKLILYFCCFYARKEKNIRNVLLNEGMKLIKDNLDISNMFKKLKDMESLEGQNKRQLILEMSVGCKDDMINMRQLAESYYYS